jgi:hypothetical protein
MAMKKVTAITARIDSKVKRIAAKWCISRGIVFSRFVEEAILDKLEECMDTAQISKLGKEPVRPFEEVLKELRLAS